MIVWKEIRIQMSIKSFVIDWRNSDENFDEWNISISVLHFADNMNSITRIHWFK